jgi:hypothetical protein
MSQRDVNIANTILQHLGGNRFRAMTGSKDFAAIESGIQFKVGRNSKSINFCRIRLNGRDLYDAEYGFMRSGKFHATKFSDDLYFDQLQADFTENTGLYTRL